MIDPSLTWQLYCRSRTGRASLLPKLGNPLINSSVLALQRVHVLKRKGHIKASDPYGNRYQRSRPRNDSSNPHSAVATTEPMSPRPRGFLP